MKAIQTNNYLCSDERDFSGSTFSHIKLKESYILNLCLYHTCLSTGAHRLMNMCEFGSQRSTIGSSFIACHLIFKYNKIKYNKIKQKYHIRVRERQQKKKSTRESTASERTHTHTPESLCIPGCQRQHN